MAKGGSKVLTAVIAFLLGFIFAILVEIGAIVGVYFYVANTELDKLFDSIGIKNRDDEGNYIYVNTDSSSGGAKDVGELLLALQGYLYSEGSSTMDYPILGKSLDDISNLLPIVQSTISKSLYPLVDKFMDMDWEEFERVSLSELPQFMSECVMNIRPAKVLGGMGMNGLVGENANILVNALLAGVEFDYAYTSTNLKFPVYYDSYIYLDELGGYYRVGDSGDNVDAYPAELSEEFLHDSGTKNDDGRKLYRLYYFPCTLSGNTLSDATLANEDGETIYVEDTTFIAVKFTSETYREEGERNRKRIYLLDEDNLSGSVYKSEYGLHNTDRTGNFYTLNGDEEELQVYPVTVRTFTDPNEVFKPLYSVGITEFLGGGENNIVGELFGSLSIGELMDGKIDFDQMVNDLALPTVVNVDPSQSVMTYIGYGLTSVTAATDSNLGYDYTGYANVDGEKKLCYITSEMKEVNSVPQPHIKEVWYYEDDERFELKGTMVKEVPTLATNMEITALLHIKADDAILSYLGYGLYNITVKQGDGYTHVGTYEIKDGDASREVTAYINTNEAGYVTEAWYVDSEFKEIIGGTTVNQLSDRLSGIMNKIAITDFMTVKCDSAIMTYIGYGVTGIRAQAGEDYTHVGTYEVADAGNVTCYISADETNKITNVYYIDNNGEKVVIHGATVNDVSARVGTFADKLTIVDVISVKATDKLMAYIGYGLTGVEANEGDGYTHTATYKNGDGEEALCYISTNEKGEITSVWYNKDGQKVYVNGTVISALSTRISGIADDLTLADVMTINESDKILWALRNTKISKVGEEVKNLKISDVLEEDAINKSAILRQLRNKTINQLSNAIDDITIQSIYSKEIYKLEADDTDPVEVNEYSSTKLYFVKNEAGEFIYVNDDIEDKNLRDNMLGMLTKEEYDAGVASGITYYSYGESQGMWRLILFKTRDDGTECEKVYTLNNFSNMVNSCTGNINNATLKTLQEAGILNPNANLNGMLTWTDSNGVHTKKLADMPLAELINAVIALSTAVPNP